jgi:hypothetical protein
MATPFFQQHIVDGPAGQVNCRGLPSQHPGGGEGIQSSACRRGNYLRNAGRARDRNVLAGRRDRRSRHHVGIEISGFRSVDCRVHCEYFAQPHLRDRIEQAGVNLQALCVDNLRVLRNVDVRSDRRYFPVANDQRSIFDGGSGQRKNFGVHQCIGFGSLRSGLRERGKQRHGSREHRASAYP